MLSAARVTWSTVTGVYDELLTLMAGSVLWTLLTIPLGLVIFAITQVFGWTPFVLLALYLLPTPAAVGVHGMAHVIANQEVPHLADFWAALRAGWRRGLIMFVVGAAVLLIIVSDIGFLLRLEEDWPKIPALILFYLGVFWLGMQLYLVPLLFEEPGISLRRAYQQAFLLAFANPIFTLFLLLVTFLFLALSSVVFLLLPLMTMSFIAVLGARGVRYQLIRYGRKPQPDLDTE